jgi:hypothetical protein
MHIPVWVVFAIHDGLIDADHRLKELPATSRVSGAKGLTSQTASQIPKPTRTNTALPRIQTGVVYMLPGPTSNSIPKMWPRDPAQRGSSRHTTRLSSASGLISRRHTTTHTLTNTVVFSFVIFMHQPRPTASSYVPGRLPRCWRWSHESIKITTVDTEGYQATIPKAVQQMKVTERETDTSLEGNIYVVFYTYQGVLVNVVQPCVSLLFSRPFSP